MLCKYVVFDISLGKDIYMYVYSIYLPIEEGYISTQHPVMTQQISSG
jgi:hypothetical protein